MSEVSRDGFEGFVREGVAAIPARFRALIRNADVVVEERPSAAQRKKMGLKRGETLLGLYEGVPQTARGEEYGGLVMPDKISIFKQPIESEALSIAEEEFSPPRRTDHESRLTFKEAVRQTVIDTVWHEVAHHFGLDEAGVERRERERGVR